MQKIQSFRWTLFIIAISFLARPLSARADDWDDLNEALKPFVGRVSYQQVVKQLPVLASSSLITSSVQSDGSILIENNGKILLQKNELLAFDQSGTLRVKFPFIQPSESISAPTSASPSTQATSKESKEDSHDGSSDTGTSSGLNVSSSSGVSSPSSQRLKGLRIHLDTNTVNALQNSPFGSLTFSEFTKVVHQRVKASLEKEGAEISETVRPNSLSLAQMVENENKKAKKPHLVVGLWFSADNQDFMMSFCDGHLILAELDTNLRKAAFIYSLLTGKVSNSVKLASCVSSECQKELSAPLLHQGEANVVQNESKGKFFFEKSTQAVPKSFNPISDLACEREASLSRFLPSSDGVYFDGIGARNTFPTKIYSRASVIVFPNRTVFQKSDGVAQITKYADGITKGILQFLQVEPIALESLH